MTDKRVREIQPGESDQPSLMPDESCEDVDDFYRAIANRNKLKDDDINALPPGEEDALIQAILADDTSTNTLPDAGDDEAEEDAEPIDDEEDTGDSSVKEKAESSIIHEESTAAESSVLEQPESPKRHQESPIIPAKSPRRQSPLSASIRPAAKPESPPSKPSAPSAKPVDPVAAYAEKRSREEMEREKEEAEKRELMIRFWEFEEAGVPCPKRFTLKSDLQEMRFEYKKLDDEFNRKKSIQMWKDGIKLVTNVVEVLNKKFDPIGWKATDFSDNLNLKLNEADWALREIHKKYFKRGGKASPELFILFAIGSVALDTHKSNVKKEEQRQQKASANAAAHLPQMPAYPWPYPPPPGYMFPGPMHFNPAVRPQQPMQQQQQQPPQQQPRPSVQMPPQQQMPQQQQQRPSVVVNPQGIPGTSPVFSPPQPQMPMVDSRPIAAAIPTPLPAPLNQQQQPDQPKRRSLRPPSEAGADLGPMANIMSGIAGAGASGPSVPPVRRTSNYGPQAVIDDDDADDESEEPAPKPKSSIRKSPLPVEPPIDASPPKVHFDDATGQLLFE